jgi:hypothetical protein
MARDPWTDPDPQPGDFDAELETIADEDLEFVEAGSGVKLTIVAGYTRGPDGRIDRWWKPSEEPPD